MRADRLVATLLLLQRRGTITASELADELEISERTARRDLEALAMAGIPLYPRRGRGGGWALVGGARTDLSGLTAGEARALFMVAGPASEATPEVRAALRKLTRALPETFRSAADAAAGAVVIDPRSWGRHHAAEERPTHLGTLQDAVIEGRQVILGYRHPAKGHSERIVHPLGLVSKGGLWYLVAGTSAGLRTFRATRVTSAEMTDQPAERPEGFDLAETWRSIAGAVDEHRSRLRVQALADPGSLGILRLILGPRLVIGPAAPDGRVALEIGGSEAGPLAAELAGFGKRLEILGPAEVVQHLARIGAELVERYGSGEPAVDRPQRRARASSVARKPVPSEAQ